VGALKTAANANQLAAVSNVSVSTVFSVKIVNRVAKATTLCPVAVTVPVKSSLRLDYNAFAMLIT